jgi:hypothetical protein
MDPQVKTEEESQVLLPMSKSEDIFKHENGKLQLDENQTNPAKIPQKPPKTAKNTPKNT